MSQNIKEFTDLKAWQESHKLCLYIYKLTQNFPKSELFVLRSQITRAAISISSNIAEGFGRYSYNEKKQFYRIALGSLMEVRNQLILARDLEYISGFEYLEADQSINLLGKLINGLIKNSIKQASFKTNY